MNTINISLPEKLKSQADALISDGHYASFSDLVRTALRGVITDNYYDMLAKEAKEDYRRGKGIVLESNEDIKKYFDAIKKKNCQKEMKIFTTKRFHRELLSLLKSHRLSTSQSQKTYTLLSSNPRHPSLRLHKLSGTNNYSVSVNKSIRIIFNWERNIVYLTHIGSHDEVY